MPLHDAALQFFDNVETYQLLTAASQLTDNRTVGAFPRVRDTREGSYAGGRRRGGDGDSLHELKLL